jgi:anthranilate phosphoribosyltransferase
MLPSYINKLIAGIDLTYTESKSAGRELLDNENETQIAAFIALLTAKGETVDEVVGLVEAIADRTVKLDIGYPTIDIVGTGGDNASTLNISTSAALLTAACGVPVLKHGNRAISSKSGAADVLEALGYPINMSADAIAAALKADKFAFCLAPHYNPLFAKVQKVRKKLGFASIFNLLGPLLNPAGRRHMLLGVYDKNRLLLIANVLQRLGTKKSLVFHGHGLDELSCLGTPEAFLVMEDKIEPITINPEALGLSKCTLDDLRGGSATYNANVIYDTLNGAKTGLTDTLILNTAAALFVFDKVVTLAEGVAVARKRLSMGNVIHRNRLIEIIAKKQCHERKHKSLKQALLSKPHDAVIAEIKRASPALGKISTIESPAMRAKIYVEAGACAISVLTDDGFDGHIKDLQDVAKALIHTEIPILRKDFILHPEQIAEAAQAGADAVLLIVAVLGNKTREFVDVAHAFGLEALVEVHAIEELPIALSAGGDVLGVNQRNLRDFKMHPEIFELIIDKIPSHIVRIAESGIKTGADAKKAFKLGYNGVLVGEALSRLDNPSDFFKGL